MTNATTKLTKLETEVLAAIREGRDPWAGRKCNGSSRTRVLRSLRDKGFIGFNCGVPFVVAPATEAR